MARTSASSRPLTDHDEIRRWAEQRGAKPTCVRGTGGSDDVGMIRLDFPGYSGEGKLEEISWDDWFQEFDESGLALLVQEKTARGQQSNFNKLVSRETAGISEDESSSGSSRSRSATASRRGQNVEEEDYEESAEDISEDESGDEDVEEDFEEETAELEESPSAATGNRRGKGDRTSRSKRKSPGRVSAGESTRSSRGSTRSRRTATARGRKQGSSSSRSASPREQGGKRAVSRASRSTAARSSAKKAPARAKASTSRSSRGRSSSSRRRAA